MHYVYLKSNQRFPVCRLSLIQFNILLPDKPRHIAISPAGYSHHVGEELTCYSDANPDADYEWTDITTGRVSKGPSIRLDENMANQNTTLLLCTATNDISNSTLSVNVTVNSKCNISLMSNYI